MTVEQMYEKYKDMNVGALPFEQWLEVIDCFLEVLKNDLSNH